MTDEVFAALRAAVTIARDRRVLRVSTLRRLVIEAGHKPEDVQTALDHWAHEERKKQ